MTVNKVYVALHIHNGISYDALDVFDTFDKAKNWLMLQAKNMDDTMGSGTQRQTQLAKIEEVPGASSIIISEHERLTITPRMI